MLFMSNSKKRVSWTIRKNPKTTIEKHENVVLVDQYEDADAFWMTFIKANQTKLEAELANEE